MKQITATIIVFALIFLCGCTGGKRESNTTEATTSEPLITTETPTTTEPVIPYTISDIEQDETFFYANEITADPADPYSAFIKKSCEEKAKVWQEAAKEDGNTTRNFYYHITTQPDFYYFLYDIDGDGTKELLLGSYYPIGYRDENPTPYVEIVITSVCSIKNGEVVKQSNAFCDPGFIWDRTLWSNGLISTTYKRQEDPSFQFVEFKNGELKAKVQVFSHYFYDEPHYYSAIYNENGQDTKISKEERDRIYNECCGDAKKVDIDWKRIDEYGT